MAVSRELFNTIREEYGEYASWAIWAENDDYNGGVEGMDVDIFRNVSMEILSELNPNFVLLGLNWSTGRPRILMNFHSRDSNIGKLRYAIRNSPLHGAYMTDLIKNHSEPNSKELMRFLRSNPEVEKENVRSLEKEISMLGTEKPIIIANGKNVYQILERNGLIARYKVIKVTHYSARTPGGRAEVIHKNRIMPILVKELNCKPW